MGLTLLAQAADDVDVAQNVGFYIIAAVMLVAAVRVVTSNNVVHAALWLVLVLAGVAAQYVLAAAEFVAVSQVLVYIGAVMVLFLFGIMLTRAQIGAEQRPQQPQLGDRHPRRRAPCSACWRGRSSTSTATTSCPSRAGRPRRRTSADAVLSDYLVPFLALSFILLAAAIGAIVLARKD